MVLVDSCADAGGPAVKRLTGHCPLQVNLGLLTCFGECLQLKSEHQNSTVLASPVQEGKDTYRIIDGVETEKDISYRWRSAFLHDWASGVVVVSDHILRGRIIR